MEGLDLMHLPGHRCGARAVPSTEGRAAVRMDSATLGCDVGLGRGAIFGYRGHSHSLHRTLEWGQ